MNQVVLHKTLQSAHGTMQLEVAFDWEPGAWIALYGPSGVGKTSILRMISGLMKPDKGKVIINGKTWLDLERLVSLPVRYRNAGFLFQDFGLFPHWTVRQNIASALRKGADPNLVEQLITTMRLTALANQRPQQLSGGQRQRTALARTLAQQPTLLLLDEPLSALDEETRLFLQEYLVDLKQAEKPSALIVSHDKQEIARLADQVLVMEAGRIANQGRPQHLWTTQASPGKVVRVEQQETGYRAVVQLDGRTITIAITAEEAPQVGETIWVTPNP